MADTIRVLPRSPGVLYRVQFTLPYEHGLSINHAYGRKRGGGLFLRPLAGAWRNGLAWQVRAIYHGVRAALASGGQIVVAWDVFAPDERSKGDHDNYGKLIFDGVKAGLEIDDKEFATGPGRAEVDAEAPRIVVVVSVEEQR